jgi:hypothetical protein
MYRFSNNLRWTILKTIALTLAFSTALVAGGCANMNYRPATQESLAKVVDDGCPSGNTAIVTGQVSQAYENTVVLADSANPSTTLAINLPGQGGPGATMHRWLGKNKYQLTAEKLNQLRAQGTPVTATVECKGAKTPPVARNIEFADADGNKVAIAY